MDEHAAVESLLTAVRGAWLALFLFALCSTAARVQQAAPRAQGRAIWTVMLQLL